MARKTLKGTIVSNKMAKTVVVRVGRKFSHPQYHKVVEKHQKYLAHAEKEHQVGEAVAIVECRPLSKRKRWRVVEEGKQTKSAKRKV